VLPTGKVVRLGLANVSLVLGDGQNNLFSVTGGQGSFILTSDGVAGTMSGTAALNVPGITFNGTLSVEVNTTPRAVNSTFIVAGTPTTINLPAGKFLRVTGTGLSLVAFGQTLKGDFSFTQSTVDPDGIPNNGNETRVVEIKVANGELGLGDGTTD